MDAAFTPTSNQPLNIHPGVFDWITQHKPFTAWQDGTCPWQLQIVGGPGSGKTTFSSLVVQSLRSQQKCPVAAIFVQKGISAHERKSFVAQVLGSIQEQLITHNITSGNSLSKKGPRIVPHRADSGVGINQLACKNSLCDPVCSRLQRLERAYLVIDDLDACGYASQLLEEELSHLQAWGLRIMTTSRVSSKEAKLIEYYCDHCEDEIWESDVQACKTCYEEAEDDCARNDACTICISCQYKGRTCTKGWGHKSLISPIRCIELLLSQNRDCMRNFVLRVIQSEHGYLGRPTGIASLSSEWPPLSDLGRTLTEANLGEDLVDETERRADGLIAWARLRLDDICKAETLEDLQLHEDRLPRNLVTLFDAGISEIGKQDEDIARLGMRAILIAGLGLTATKNKAGEDRWRLGCEDDDFRGKNPGVPFASLSDCLCTLESKSHPNLTLRKMLHAAKGFLSVNTVDGSRVTVYHRDFGLYVCEKYSTGLETELKKMRKEMIKLDGG